MTSAVLMLAAVSGLVGVALGLYGFRWGALALAGVILAIVSAIVLQRENFGFVAGVAVAAGLLTVNQITYVIGLTIFALAAEDTNLPITSSLPDHHPSEDSQ